MNVDTTIKRPALRYYGGKWNLAPWIISHFPPHKNYVEPCGGAASVLLQKPRSPLETYNDLDGNVVNFFRVLRDNPNELIRKIRLTPWSRAEKDLAFEPTNDDLERARRFWCAIQMSISASMGYAPGFRVIKTHEQIYSHPDLFDKDLDSLNFAYRRFAGVQIENIDALDCAKKYANEETLTYFDPPYPGDTRTHTRYFLEADKHEFHTRAAEAMRQLPGSVIVSGYACPLYTELYEAHGWKRIDRMAQTNSGGKRVESLWLNPRTVEAQQQPALFP